MRAYRLDEGLSLLTCRLIYGAGSGLEGEHARFGALSQLVRSDTSMTSRKGVYVSVCRFLRRRLTVSAALCVLAAGGLAGCASSGGMGSLIVDPGHYSVYHCDALAKRLNALLAREQDLSNLMAKASEGGAGVVIANLSYRADYESTLGEERVLRRTAAEKKCDLPPPVTVAAPTPATYSAPPGTTPAPAYQSDQTIR